MQSNHNQVSHKTFDCNSATVKTKINKCKNQQYRRNINNVELSFEEELDFVGNEFEEDGLENLSSEGNEWISNSTYTKPPKANDHNLSRNNQIGNSIHFRTDKSINSRNHLFNGEFLSNKFTQSSKQKDEENLPNHQVTRHKRCSDKDNRKPNQCEKLRRAVKKTPNGLNRSRNKNRYTDSTDMNHATSSILGDKLRNTLTSIE